MGAVMREAKGVIEGVAPGVGQSRGVAQSCCARWVGVSVCQ